MASENADKATDPTAQAAPEGVGAAEAKASTNDAADLPAQNAKLSEERRELTDGVKVDEAVTERLDTRCGLELDDEPRQIERVDGQLSFEERRVGGERGRRGAFGGRDLPDSRRDERCDGGAIHRLSGGL